jgi:hypothetical protein
MTTYTEVRPATQIEQPVLNPALDLLVRARRLIEDPAHWTQNVCSDGKGRHCAVGAIYSAGGISSVSVLSEHPEVRSAIRGLDVAAWALGQHNIVDVNDLLGHDAILSCFDAAIEEASRAG